VVAGLTAYSYTKLSVRHPSAGGTVTFIHRVSLAEAASASLGQVGFVIVGISAVLATFSAINATLYGAARLSYTIAVEGELPGGFRLRPWHQPIGLHVTAVLGAVIASTHCRTRVVPWVRPKTGAGYEELTGCKRRTFAREPRCGVARRSDWAYRLEADEGGTEVAEEWTSNEAKWMETIANTLLQVDSRAEFNCSSRETTLAAMAAEVEATS
jgi:hypothetical protein